MIMYITGKPFRGEAGLFGGGGASPLPPPVDIEPCLKGQIFGPSGVHYIEWLHCIIVIVRETL